METARRAVIDVGTNSVKLLVADVAGREVRPVLEKSQQTRLGQGFYETRWLQPQAIEQTAAAVAAFTRDARELGANTVRVIATSAARDARNPEDLLAAIESATKLKVEIISGEQEAELGFRGVMTDPALARHTLLLLDVGGGSTELILGRAGHHHFRRSLALGTVRLLEQIPHGDPPAASELEACRKSLRQCLDQQVRSELEAALARESKRGATASGISDARAHRVQFAGIGGTATILGRMASSVEGFDRERIEATRLTFEEIGRTVSRLWSLPLAERKQIPGLPANRADVILFGLVIFEAVMEQFGFADLRISTRGLRFAAVLDAA